MEHAQLIETSAVNYLAGLNTWTQPLLFLAGESNLDKAEARIVAYLPEGAFGEEDPPTSGNRWCDLTFELRTPFSKLTAAQVAAGAVDPLTQHQNNAAALAAAVLNVNLPDLLTAAVAGFTCFGLTERTPLRQQDAQFWMSGWKVRLLSCPSAIAA